MCTFTLAQPAEDAPSEPFPVTEPTLPADTPPPMPAEDAPPTTEEPQSTPGVDMAVARLITEGGTVQANNAGGTTLWQTNLGADVTATLSVDEVVYAAQGLYVVELDAASGMPLERHATPHPPVALEALTEGVMVRFRGADPMLLSTMQQTPQPFGLHLETMNALRLNVAPDDPTNPWTQRRQLQDGLPNSLRTDRLEALRQAAEPLPFFETAALVTDLLNAGLASWDEVEPLAAAAIRDMLSRGYDPRLVSSEAAAEAYGLPYPTVRATVDDGRLDAGVRLIPWAALTASAEVPASVVALQDLADALSRSGQTDDAENARAAAREVARFATPNAGRALVHHLARFGWWGVASLTAVTVLMGLTLLAKVWPAQSFRRRQLKQQGRRPASLLRLTLVRHVATTEKLVMLTLLLAIGATASLAAWYAPQRGTPPVLQAGTFATAEALAAIDALPESDLAAWMRGLHHAQSGDDAAAQAAWTAASSQAEVATNLALLRDNPAGLEAALQLDPREPIARHALGRSEPPAPFVAYSEPGYTLLAVPSAADVNAAALGDWQDALTGWWPSPGPHLASLKPPTVPLPVAYATIGLWSLLVVVWTAALFVPRPRVSRKAPRTFAYHVLALLLPGAGHADELWGLILLVPFALFAGDLIVTNTTASPGLGVTPALSWGVLVGSWAANAVGFSVEWSSHRRRMTQLKTQNPELAAAFGLRVGRPVEGPRDA